MKRSSYRHPRKGGGWIPHRTWIPALVGMTSSHSRRLLGHALRLLNRWHAVLTNLLSAVPQYFLTKGCLKGVAAIHPFSTNGSWFKVDIVLGMAVWVPYDMALHSDSAHGPCGFPADLDGAELSTHAARITVSSDFQTAPDDGGVDSLLDHAVPIQVQAARGHSPIPLHGSGKSLGDVGHMSGYSRGDHTLKNIVDIGEAQMLGRSYVAEKVRSG